jgi:spore maturation protein B
MNAFFASLIPVIFILSFLYAVKKKVKVYDAFTEGAKGAIPLVTTIFPYIACVMMLSELFAVSGLEQKTLEFISPAFEFFGVPKEIAPLVLMKPLSGNGSIALLSDILTTYGADGYISRCACVAYGSSETVLYIGAVYFAGLKRKSLTAAIVISLISFVASIIFGCFLCKIM